MTVFRSSFCRYSSILLLGILPVLGASACSKSEDNSASTGSKTKIAPVPKVEAERAMIACKTYIARLCQCAETHSELAKDCQLAKGIPQALQMNLDVEGATGLTSLQQQAMKASARQIATSCFTKDSKLDLQLCPRIK